MRRFRFLGVLVLAAVLLGAVLALRGRVAEVGGAGHLPGPGVSATAVALSLAGNLLLVDAWRAIVAAVGPRLPFAAAARVWTASQLARYTLGAAQVPGRALAGRGHGVGVGVGVLTTLVEILWGASLTAVVVLVTAPAGGAPSWVAAAALLPAALVVLGLAAPAEVLARLARLLRRPPLAGVDRRLAAAVTARYALVIVLRVTVTLLLYRAVGGDPGADWPVVAGAWAVGQLAGQFAVFAPGGLGVREGATALVLAPAVGADAALLLVALLRLAELAAELCAFAAAHGLRHQPPGGDQQQRVDAADPVAHVGQVGRQADQADRAGRR